MGKCKFLIILAAAILAGCTSKTGISLKGSFKGKAGSEIYISKVDINIPVKLDSAKIGRNGKFSFSFKGDLPEFYQLGFSSTEFVTLLAAPGEKIKMTFRGKNIVENYSVKGSPGTEKVKMLDSVLARTKIRLDSLSTVYRKESSEPGFEQKKQALETQFAGILKEQRHKTIAFIINNINSLASIKALYQRINPDTYVLYDPKDLQYMKIVSDSLTRHYPRSRDVQALAQDFSKEMNQMYASRIAEMAKNLPETKLDPDLKTIEGKRIALSSLKGKYVLLSFWSVQSRDCIAENLELKDYYKKYHNLGFEIYQINIDQNESDWRRAVKFDELPWINTREDNPADPVNARIFNVRSVPANFFFDKTGKIIATDLHGRALQIMLTKIFNKE